MASAAPKTARGLVDVLRISRPRPVCECLYTSSLRRKNLRPSRNVSTAASHLSEMEVEPESPPRWSHTPPAMKAPYRASPPKEQVRVLVCNSDPQKLDEVYVRFLGRGGDKLLSDESKWLAVTAKSFDHGRRGFNDRLAFFGKRILELQCSLGLLNARDGSKHFLKDHEGSHGRAPFSHPATDAIEVLSGGARHWFTHHKQLSTIAQRNGFHDVVRWHPKYQDNLDASGAALVYSQALMAVIGALALEQGSAVANRIARERVLLPLGLKSGMKEKLEEPARQS